MPITFICNETDTIMIMPSGTQPESSPLARAVSAEIRAVMARHRISHRRLSERSGISRSYLGKRLRDEVPFTLNDVEAICLAMREDIPGLLDAAFKRMESDGRARDWP